MKLKKVNKFWLTGIILLTCYSCYLSKPVKENEHLLDESAFEAYSTAVVLNERGQYNEALQEINTAINMNDKISKFFVLKAEILENSGRKLDALAVYKQVLNIQIYNPVVHEKMGQLLADLGQYHSAIQSVKKAYAQKPLDTRLLIVIAGYYIQMESYDRAEGYLITYENQTPQSEYQSDYYCVKARIYFHSGEFEKTVNALDKCRASKPFTKELHKLYLNALLNSKKYDAIYQHLAGLNSDIITKGDQHFYKGIYYYHTNNYSDALSQLELALGLKTEDSRVYYYLGKVHLELGNLSKSKEMFDVFRAKTEQPELEDVQIGDMDQSDS